MPRIYYQRAEGILLVYDITNLKSFENIDIWMKRIDENARENIPIILVGTKADLVDDREVVKEEGEKKAMAYQIKFFEVSARENSEVEKCFEELLT